MQSGNPALVSALKAGERNAAQSIRLGGQDMSGQVQEWSLDSGYSTDLPDAMRAFSGSSSTQLELSVGGAGGKSAPALYGPWAPRATGDVSRPGQSVVQEWGVNGQTLPAFRGSVRSRTAQSGGDTVRVSALDGAERLRMPADLPRPAGGLDPRTTRWWTTDWVASASWCVDHLLRNAGIHTCPPPRQGCILYASLHGGAAANIGTLTRLEGMWKFWTKDQAPHEMCFDWYAGKSTAEYVPSVRPVNRGNTPGLFYEAWINNANIPGDGLVESGIEFTMAWSDANNQLTYTSALMQFNTAIKTTQMVVAVGTNEDPSKNGGATWDGWDVKPKKGTFHLGLWMEFDSSGKAILLPRLTAPDGVVHFGVPASSPSAVPPGSLAFIRLVIQNLRVEAVQLSQLATRPLGAALTQTGMWQKTATLDLPDAPLRVIPQVSGSAWDVITQIAAATLSTAEFDTNGVFRWQGRNRWSIAPATPSLTVTSDRELASLTVTEEIDACRNYITVPWDNWLSVQTTDSVANPLYNVARLGPGEWAELWWLVGDNQFDAMPPLTKPGAVGENAIRFVSADSDSAPQVFGAVEVGLRKVDGRFYLTMRNRSTSVVFLRGATSGAVSVNVKSPAVSSGDNPVRYSATSQNTTSQAAYRVQTYNHDSGGWVQTAESATAVADALLKAGQYPAPILGDVEILPDPRLQLGDVVRVVDQTGASLDTLAWIVGNKLSASAGAVKQTLTLRGTTYNGVPQDAGLTPDPPVRL